MRRETAPGLVADGPDGPRLTGPDMTPGRYGAGRRRGFKKALAFSVTLLITVFVTGISANAAGTLNEVVTTLFGESTQTVDIIILLTILTLLPSIVIMLTGFTRIIIVLSFVRNALGMQQTPPNQVLIGLALFLTLFVMGPFVTAIYNDAYIPYTNGEIAQDEFLSKAMGPARNFMLDQTTNSDLSFFIDMAGEEIEFTLDEEGNPDFDAVPNRVLIPAFMTSEIKRAFSIGFMIFIPFIVIDMVVASTLMSMGMMMLPPAMISLPFKVVLFVLVDGWQMIIGSLVKSFGYA